MVEKLKEWRMQRRTRNGRRRSVTLQLKSGRRGRAFAAAQREGDKIFDAVKAGGGGSERTRKVVSDRIEELTLQTSERPGISSGRCWKTRWVAPFIGSTCRPERTSTA